MHVAGTISAMAGTASKPIVSAAAVIVVRIMSKEPIKLNGVIACIFSERLDFLSINRRVPEVNCCTL